MKVIISLAVLLFTLTACQSDKNKKQVNSTTLNSTTMENKTAKTEIEKSLGIYFDALNKSNVEQAVHQYTSDGIFMPTGLPTAAGTSELTTAYENVFKAIQLNVTFRVEEIILSDSIAFVRTQSNGTQLIHANNQKTDELNREFFLMKNENGSWKISRYMFNQPK
ncbi:Ketosteroid isomerase homolog [Chryseobacterium rhizoplanae]|uniref:Ketosteroid isomerase homolog n=1 Tax=Chryseobacterium rhizoplanae TaxID=1609531 RepID=A0A521AMK1_9FLAO|nr:nuclear transport factor 2 family protein [Chryseobacterium rhizoplanae]SMO35880.1 Ketosteroid isomerase homolog [Chryseobacterium rhizoplanae]